MKLLHLISLLLAGSPVPSPLPDATSAQRGAVSFQNDAGVQVLGAGQKIFPSDGGVRGNLSVDKAINATGDVTGANVWAATGRLISRNASGGMSIGSAGTGFIDVPTGTNNVNFNACTVSFSSSSIVNVGTALDVDGGLSVHKQLLPVTWSATDPVPSNAISAGNNVRLLQAPLTGVEGSPIGATCFKISGAGAGNAYVSVIDVSDGGLVSNMLCTLDLGPCWQNDYLVGSGVGPFRGLGDCAAVQLKADHVYAMGLGYNIDGGLICGQTTGGGDGGFNPYTSCTFALTPN